MQNQVIQDDFEINFAQLLKCMDILYSGTAGYIISQFPAAGS